MVIISVPEAPSTCLGTWSWNAAYYDPATGEPIYRNGLTVLDSVGVGEYGGYYEITITDQCL